MGCLTLCREIVIGVALFSETEILNRYYEGRVGSYLVDRLIVIIALEDII